MLAPIFGDAKRQSSPLMRARSFGGMTGNWFNGIFSIDPSHRLLDPTEPISQIFFDLIMPPRRRLRYRRSAQDHERYINTARLQLRTQ